MGCTHHPKADCPSTYLHCSGGSGGAGAHLEQPRCCRSSLASFPGGSTLVNNQGLSTKHAHQVRGLFALHYSFLKKKKLPVSFEECKTNQKWLLQSSVELEYSQSTQLGQVFNIYIYIYTLYVPSVGVGFCWVSLPAQGCLPAPHPAVL